MKQTLLAAFGAAALALFALPEDAEARDRDRDRHHRHATTSVSAVFYPYGQFAYVNDYHYRDGYGRHHRRHWAHHHRPHGPAYGYWKRHHRHDRDCR